MNAEDIRDYALQKAGVEEGFPFGEGTLVFKTHGKMFLTVGLYEQPLRFNAKCDPERAVALREQYSCVIPGYHMNKTHWNTVYIDNTLTNKQLKELIDHSYDLIAVKLKGKMHPDNYRDKNFQIIDNQFKKA